MRQIGQPARKVRLMCTAISLIDQLSALSRSQVEYGRHQNTALFAQQLYGGAVMYWKLTCGRREDNRTR